VHFVNAANEGRTARPLGRGYWKVIEEAQLYETPNHPKKISDNKTKNYNKSERKGSPTRV
jgi:hypothetical protein